MLWRVIRLSRRVSKSMGQFKIWSGVVSEKRTTVHRRSHVQCFHIEIVDRLAKSKGGSSQQGSSGAVSKGAVSKEAVSKEAVSKVSKG